MLSEDGKLSLDKIQNTDWENHFCSIDTDEIRYCWIRVCAINKRLKNRENDMKELQKYLFIMCEG